MLMMMMYDVDDVAVIDIAVIDNVVSKFVHGVCKYLPKVGTSHCIRNRL